MKEPDNTSSGLQYLCRRSMPLFIMLAFILLAFAEGRAQRPNIIYVMTDDMGYGDLGCYGNKKFATPNIDALASKGVKFLNAYSAAPVCTPTRTALMTGRYPARTPVGLMEPLRSPAKDSAYGLTKDIPSLAMLMKESGYETALIGKWHLGFMPQQSPGSNGFDYFFGTISGGTDYVSFRGSNGTGDHDLYENENRVFPKGYLTDIFTQQSVSFIRKEHSKPFMLIITFNAPHWPWQGPNDPAYPDTANMTSGGSADTYARMMKSLDDGFGRIMAALDERNLTGETIVIFTNDNGGERYSDNGGLTNGKFTLWEGGIRVPAIVRWPGKIAAGTITDQVAVTMDWTATILAAGNAKESKSHPLDGVDLMPVLTGKRKTIERTLYWRTFQRSKNNAVREGKWKYLKDEKGEYLFDLSLDPKEKNDLKLKEATRFNRMKAAFSSWESTVLPPIPL